MVNVKLVNKVICAMFFIFSAFNPINLRASESNVLDLLVIVEPGVYNNSSKESINKLIIEQSKNANSEYNEYGITVNLKSIVEWNGDHISNYLYNGLSLPNSAGKFIYSLGESEGTFNEKYPELEGGFYSEINDLVNSYNADKILIITTATSELSSGEVIYGRAFENKGVVLSFDYLGSIPLLLAHELGHTFGLGHTSNDDCDLDSYLMCNGNYLASMSESIGLTEVEGAFVSGVVRRDPAFLTDYYNQNFWVGDFSESTPFVSGLKIDLSDSSIGVDEGEIEIVLTLIDFDGTELILEIDSLVGLFIEGDGFDASSYYDTSKYMRVTFLSGESSKRIGLSVEHSDIDMALNIGTRFGIDISDSNVVNLEVEAKVNDNNDSVDVTTPTSDTSSGGGFGFLSLFSLLLIVKIRRFS